MDSNQSDGISRNLCIYSVILQFYEMKYSNEDIIMQYVSSGGRIKTMN